MGRLISFIAALCLLASCEKKEQALVLPPPSGASHAGINMGATYDLQLFFDFESGAPVHSSMHKSWDLAFETSPDGRHVFMNGGKNVYVYNTHSQEMTQMDSVPESILNNVLTDASCGGPDETGIGQWYDHAGRTKGEVYIVQNDTEPKTFQNLRILSANSEGYTIEWTPLESSDPPVRVELKKDTAYNYIYFSFANGVVRPEPPKDTWDVVFTQYRPLVYDTRTQVKIPYVVTGVLLNPTNTMAAADSTMPFSEITLQSAIALPASGCRDAIGYDWKTIDLYGIGGRYTVNRAKNYILHTRKGQIYKLRFLDFYNSQGEKGNPQFEYVRLR